MKTSREYQQEIANWANHNFTYIDKVGYGMIEELGEYCHAILKSRQGIRRLALKGGDYPKLVTEEATFKWKKLEPILKDCIGDALVFTLHWAEANETFISFEEVRTYVQRWKETSEHNIISILLHELSQMILDQTILDQTPDILTETFKRLSAQRIFQNFASLAKCRGWDWKKILDSVWSEVKQRDWIKYPINGKSK